MTVNRPRASKLARPTAQKDHQCFECGGRIERGDTYVRLSGVWDEPQTFKFCAPCYALWEKYDFEGHFGELRRVIIEGIEPREITEFPVEMHFMSRLLQRQARIFVPGSLKEFKETSDVVLWNRMRTMQDSIDTACTWVQGLIKSDEDTDDNT